MSAKFARGQLLFEQHRYEAAEQEFRGAIAEDPQAADAYAMLGLCLCERKQFDQAEQEINTGISLAPHDAFGHYARARMLQKRERPNEAREAIDEAIRLAPWQSGLWFVLATIEVSQERWTAALEAAERGLELDPEDDGCTNMRTLALTKLGRQDEAQLAIGAALARDPQNALSQANQGWALLEQGDHRQALVHFREALRLEPEMEWAREGIVMAMKAKNPLYRLPMNYYLWMSRLGPQKRWGFIIGLYIAYQITNTVRNNNPELAPWLLPLVVVYVAFVAMTWLADPLFNLLLRIDPMGRHALSRDETMSANLVGICMLGVLGGLALAILARRAEVLLLPAMAALLMLPASCIFRCRVGWPRWAMGAYTLSLVLAPFLGVVLVFTDSADAFGPLLMFYIIGCLAASWVANLLMTVRPQH